INVSSEAEGLQRLEQSSEVDVLRA
ncbi:hypothetical protein A2U01_0069126, partial [Trifolium medium]|nr:hypothetical protein [Trifolium medium]